ncbi:MAG: hypothetical protein LBS25_05570 [Candidatus Symbiothrix sp.]|jgi:hypothetical protein|nr:hypothetical protein [Candidatus Symbiothrix sp.]
MKNIMQVPLRTDLKDDRNNFYHPASFSKVSVDNSISSYDVIGFRQQTDFAIQRLWRRGLCKREDSPMQTGLQNKF